MAIRNLNKQDIQNLLEQGPKPLVEFELNNTHLYAIFEDDQLYSYMDRERLLPYLQQEYLNDWGFVKSIDHLEFYYDKSIEPAATIKYTINWIDEDDTEIAVSKLSRGDKGWAVLIFYEDELTLIKKDLYEYEAHGISVELSADLSEWNITELIRSEGFEKYVYI